MAGGDRLLLMAVVGRGACRTSLNVGAGGRKKEEKEGGGGRKGEKGKKEERRRRCGKKKKGEGERKLWERVF